MKSSILKSNAVGRLGTREEAVGNCEEYENYLQAPIESARVNAIASLCCE